MLPYRRPCECSLFSYTRFINTMKQEPVVEQLLPFECGITAKWPASHDWDYIYEPDAVSVIDDLLRYVDI